MRRPFEWLLLPLLSTTVSDAAVCGFSVFAGGTVN